MSIPFIIYRVISTVFSCIICTPLLILVTQHHFTYLSKKKLDFFILKILKQVTMMDMLLALIWVWNQSLVNFIKNQSLVDLIIQVAFSVFNISRKWTWLITTSVLPRFRLLQEIFWQCYWSFASFNELYFQLIFQLNFQLQQWFL